MVVNAHPEVCRPSQKARANKRTRQWLNYLGTADETTLNLADLQLIGSPPPIDVPDAWAGRQCAFIESGKTSCLGEIVTLRNGILHVRTPVPVESARTLLVRDAWTQKNGLLVTAIPFSSKNLQFLPPPDTMPYSTPHYCGGPRPAIKMRVFMQPCSMESSATRCCTSDCTNNSAACSLIWAIRADYPLALPIKSAMFSSVMPISIISAVSSG